MEFPDSEIIDGVLDSIRFPRFLDVRYDPETPQCEDVDARARTEADRLLDSYDGGDSDRADGDHGDSGIPEGGTIAIGLGSRGITDILPVARATIEAVRARGFEPVIVPAMGSHGGATPEGQVETLAGLGLTEENLECAIDPRMETIELRSEGESVHFAQAAREADAVLAVNRIKPHTNFEGHFESGLTKMFAVGLGKQAGARAIHERALTEGYVPVIAEALETIQREIPVIGGLAIIENRREEIATIEALASRDLPDGEQVLLDRAREYMPTLPFSSLDALIVERIGKDVSGTGVDTNVIGRYRVLNAEDPASPEIDRICVLGLTEATHGNGMGIGLADVTTTLVANAIDFEQVYANALTSSSLAKASLPVALPTDEQAVTAALTSVGTYDPEKSEVAWIRDSSHLSSFRISEALADRLPAEAEIVGRSELTFEDGEPNFESIE
ncbi:DUF362 domain-containing protein [Halobacteriales archaeon QS_3_64_16]|nr:MAG: DUF362 domain-containing protein [Halobacteriales archaeon QS_3_64_16]